MRSKGTGGRVSKVVRQVFGLPDLRPGQQAVIAAYEERRQRDQAKLEQMVIYAQTALCRTHVLLEALGETVPWLQCGTCDNCRGLAVRSEAVAEGAA